MQSIREKIYSWGYVLNKIPSGAPFIFGQTRCSLETGAAYLGAKKVFYMNSMFSPERLQADFPHIDPDCVKNRLSDTHFQFLAGMDEVICTLEHGRYLESARQIGELSLRHPTIKGALMDDFNMGSGKVTPLELKAIRDALRSRNPALKLVVVTYSHLSLEEQVKPFTEHIDMVTRWQWIASQDYWDNIEEDLDALSAAICGKPIIQGIYLHDFGSSMKCQYPVPFEVFQKSIKTICEKTFTGKLDGFIIPQAGWFSDEKHREHVQWMKSYIDWFCDTTTVR